MVDLISPIVHRVSEVVIAAMRYAPWRKAAPASGDSLEELRKSLTTAHETIARLHDELAQAKKEARTAQTPDLSAAGWYLSQEGERSLMGSINEFLDIARVPATMPRMQCACDFAAFGAVTWREEFHHQRRRMTELVKVGVRANKRVEMVFNSHEVNREILVKQFPDLGWKQYLAVSAERIRHWVADETVAFALTADRPGLGPVMTRAEHAALVSGQRIIERERFIEAFLEFNERVIGDYQQAGARVTRYGNPVPLHAWLEEDNNGGHRGIFGLADTLAVWNEPGFFVRGEVAGVVWNLVHDVHERGR